MIAAEDEEVLGIFDLVGEEEANGLERLLASIDVIAEEEIVGFGRESTILEQTEQVIVLSMDVTCDVSSPYQLERRGRVGIVNSPQILMGASSSSRMG